MIELYIEKRHVMIYRLKPEFREKIWGGHKFRDLYHMDCGDGLVGEGWLVACLPGKEDSEVEGTGMRLSQLYNEHNELFGFHDTDVVPIKFLLGDCNENTSVQLHPNNEYARKYENSLGKSECVFFLEVEPDSIAMYGHNAENKKQLREMIDQGRWNELLRVYEHPKKNDFAYVPAGRVHTTCKGVVLLELSGNADKTYRLYDFDRVGPDGKKRQLDIDKAMDVILCPDKEDPFVEPTVEDLGDLKLYTYIDKPGEFSAFRLLCDGKGEFGLEEFSFWFISEGEGIIDGKKVKKGETWFVPCKQEKLKIEGKLETVIGSYKS